MSSISDQEIREIRKLAIQYAMDLAKIVGDHPTVKGLVANAYIIEKYIVVSDEK